MNLNARSSDSIEFLQAINECGQLLQPSIALLYTPDWCGFAQVEQLDGSAKLSVSPEADERFDQATIFEARVFNERAELRWLKQSTGQGRAALISEDDISQYLTQNAAPSCAVQAFSQPYLLWGEGTALGEALRPNWSRLAMARIGMLDIPYPLDSGLSRVARPGERIYLITTEYFAAVDDHGNVSVIDERLRKLVDDNELIRLSNAGEVVLEVYS